MPEDTPTRLLTDPDQADPGTSIRPTNDPLLEADLWEKLIEGSEIVRAHAGAVLYESSMAFPLLAIVDGVARVFIWTAGGRQTTLRYARAGDLVGLPAALCPAPRVSAEAVTDTVVALVSLDRLHELSVQHARLTWPIAKQMARWGGDVDLKLVGLEHRSMTARIAGHILELATRKAGGEWRALISQEHLAVAAGTVREVATRSIAELRGAGVVVTRPGAVVIVDPVRLSWVAGGGDLGAERASGQMQPAAAAGGGR